VPDDTVAPVWNVTAAVGEGILRGDTVPGVPPLRVPPILMVATHAAEQYTDAPVAGEAGNPTLNVLVVGCTKDADVAAELRDTLPVLAEYGTCT
jgi:hypothetical protein